MKLIRNAAGISTLILILLLLIAAIVGAVLSYMWTMGYYVNLGVRLPETPIITITNITFNPQDPTFFNLVLLNPTFSPFKASVNKVMVSREDSSLESVSVLPTLPQEFSIGKSKTLICNWNWMNHTNENIKIHVFITDGSGATFQTQTPIVELVINEVVFNSTISFTHFNMTVQNSASSVTYVNIKSVTLNTEVVQNLTPVLPYTLQPNASIALICSLNWTNYQGEEVTVKVETSQGYTTHYVHTIPGP